MPEFTPQAMAAHFSAVAVDVDRGMGEVCTALAVTSERQAKINASTGAHRRGTPTPAIKNVTGPSVITGNLRRNITHGQARRVRVGVWRSVVGVAGGASYGEYVADAGFRYLEPAVDFAYRTVAPTLMDRRFGARAR